MTTEKVLIVILVILGIAYLFMYMNKKKIIENDGSVTMQGQIVNNYDNMEIVDEDQIEASGERVADGYIKNYGYAIPENGYINSNYATGKRGNQFNNTEIDSFFDQNNNIIASPFTDQNVQVTGLDETQGKFNVFMPTNTSCSSNDNQNCDPNDLYNIDNYLPQQKIPSFFEVDAEPIPVKDRALVNVSRTMGINQILTSKKYSSYDIRGGINNPRYVVSPWNQSTIEPNDDYRPLN
ncbi:hypothetical protein Hokovirus_2_73 [Hokovirus HKV1]|uniref:Minor capsid protein P11 C-terminal conserved region domain-containing protein n=1 Tax=Hokovirus HKV1 TaxID=1977638 RepID=A0A1V0SFP0_9VIRU|nr:hypothetical protein Hokovirus_2_73 [Hokovirus HKV1]